MPTVLHDKPASVLGILRNSLAFDTITACKVVSVECLARSALDTPAQTVVDLYENHALAVHMSMPKHRKAEPSTHS